MEFRESRPFYWARIYDKAVMKWIDAHEHDASVSDEDFDCADPVRPVRTIHFYNYNKTWSLDVSVKETGMVALTDEGVRMLQERFSCHEQDENYAILNAQGVPQNERPILFYFAIDRVLSSSL